jgi:hypothetical protein
VPRLETVFFEAKDALATEEVGRLVADLGTFLGKTIAVK